MVPSLSLDGRHALVCGASAGIGRATAMALGAAGARVTVLARSESKLIAAVNELQAAGAPDPDFAIVDLDDLGGLRRKIHLLRELRGPVQILVNNAGGPPPGPLLAASSDAFERGMRRHLLAAHELVLGFLPGMRGAHYGRIVNVVSTSVYEPLPGLGVSNTVRAAVAGWAKSLSRELDPGITINNVLPGFTGTERLCSLADELAGAADTTPEAIRSSWLSQVPEGRLGRADEPAALIAFLCSPAAAYIRGQSISVDGGRQRSI